MKRKIKLAQKHLKGLSAFCIQESHGNWTLLKKHFWLILRDFWVFASFGNPNAGGVIVFVSKSVAPDPESIHSEEILEGRAIRIHIQGPTGSQFIYNIHNFGLAGRGMSTLCSRLAADVEFCSYDPLSLSVFAVGDFNLPSIEKFSYSDPKHHNMETTTAESGAASGDLAGILAKLLEIETQLPTRYDCVADVANKLDCIYTNTPAEICPLNRWEAKTPYDPKHLWETGLSDHALIVAPISHTLSGGAEKLPIAPDIFRCPLFCVYLDRLNWEDRVDELTGFVQTDCLTKKHTSGCRNDPRVFAGP